MAWKASPQRALWYGEVIFEDHEGQTDYHYAYSASPFEPDPELILPKSMWGRILETTVRPTPRNDQYEGPEGDE
ncbi:hypothetical protein [Streptomyces sp. NPDC059874]|uniref:hypothetical protein n=1 Tax=Streptomyces sp. NPDC059874 TaxID=3346983 RepID=UPI00364F3EFA